MSENKYNLTLKQKRFADEYIKNGGNATQAYKDAGYAWGTEPTANTNSVTLLRNHKVARYINERINKVEKKTIVKQIDAVQEIDKLLAEALTVDQLGVTSIEEFDGQTDDTGRTIIKSTTKKTQKPRIAEIARLLDLKLKFEQLKKDTGQGVNINITADGMVDIDEDD